ncbi:SPW repeat domain-containing protein [Halopiger djelfimassiliensis]|uniref:SPW repeat domain-containing protein n=1 Tax=Halopiger djelfimassiliensis TaxID=1293047 RepID=UPI0006780663|nr:hypothetical protein [Halopiger djelfimassiliensis]
MSDPSDDHRTADSGPESESAADDGPGNPTEKAAADIDSGTGVGDRTAGGPDPRDDSTQIANEERRRKTSYVSVIVAVLGAWVALSTLLFDVGQAGLWNNLSVGALVFVAAGYNYYRVTNDVPLSVGVASLVAVLGIWLIVSAALLELTGGLFWSTLVSGLLVAGLAGYNAYEAREARTVATEPETRA